MNCVRALRTSLSASQLCVNHYMQSAKALLICMDACSEVTDEAQAIGRNEGDNNSGTCCISNFKTKRVKKFRTLETDGELSYISPALW